VLHNERPEHEDRGWVFLSTIKAGLQLGEEGDTQVGIEQEKRQNLVKLVAR